jgi:hypothetical protein
MADKDNHSLASICSISNLSIFSGNIQHLQIWTSQQLGYMLDIFVKWTDIQTNDHSQEPLDNLDLGTSWTVQKSTAWLISSLEQFLHMQFDKLALWLEAVVVSPNERCGYHNDLKLCRHNTILSTASAQSMTT